MEKIVASVSQHMDGYLADQYLSETYPVAGKIVSALALFGVACVNRKLCPHKREKGSR